MPIILFVSSLVFLGANPVNLNKDSVNTLEDNEAIKQGNDLQIVLRSHLDMYLRGVGFEWQIKRLFSLNNKRAKGDWIIRPDVELGVVSSYYWGFLGPQARLTVYGGLGSEVQVEDWRFSVSLQLAWRNNYSWAEERIGRQTPGYWQEFALGAHFAGRYKLISGREIELGFHTRRGFTLGMSF